ncbi:hypothetical protein FcAc13_00190 [Frischella sp. Ac13]|uniref:Uncharacterized protein n=1 Tax=Frischella japonica TaxID=2741544 RepID=A0ABR7QU35_9GAMM|nr:hypothetical protein [Frischella japonica]MBC9129731.1 hypothetical protein [Frischella japonica]
MATLPLKTGLTASQYKPSLHVECFTCEDLPTFITQTPADAGKIPSEERFIHIWHLFNGCVSIVDYEKYPESHDYLVKHRGKGKNNDNIVAFMEVIK